jgi:competence protein ComEA
MKKILFFMLLSVSFLFSAINLQTASKEELICIKGIGEKKANAILNYRKSNNLDSIDKLIKIKGFGKVLISNVKKEIKSVACGGKKPFRQSLKKEREKNKVSRKETISKKITKKNMDKKSIDTKKKDNKKKEELVTDSIKTEKKINSSEK